MRQNNELLGYPRLKIYQDTEMFSFSIDSILLAHFVRLTKKTKHIIDLGTGNAAIPLYLSLKTQAAMIGVEIQDKVFELAIDSVKDNQLEKQITILHDDMIGISDRVGRYKFDVVTANPPFFKLNPTSRLNKNDYLSIARHEIKMSLEGLIKEASLLMNNGGSFYMVHRPDRLTDILSLLRQYKLEPKRLQFVHPRTGVQPNHILIEAVKGREEGGLVVLKPLIVYTKDKWTKEILNIYNYGRDSYVTKLIKP
jgi:tRNA1Val (adenine37-N6)-methyltransferase